MQKTICFNVEIEEEFQDDLKKIVDHHIDHLIDTESFPEIKRIFDAEIVDGSFKAISNCYYAKQKDFMKEDLDNNYPDIADSVKSSVIEYLLEEGKMDNDISYWDNIKYAIEKIKEKG